MSRNVAARIISVLSSVMVASNDESDDMVSSVKSLPLSLWSYSDEGATLSPDTGAGARDSRTGTHLQFGQKINIVFD